MANIRKVKARAGQIKEITNDEAQKLFEDKAIPEIKVDEILKGVKVDDVELTPDANRMVNIPVMAGASALTNGEMGLVPKPLSGQQGTFLRGDGTYGLPNADVVASASYIGGTPPQEKGMTCSVDRNNVEILLDYPYVAREAFPDAVDIVSVMRNGLVLAEGKDFTIEEGAGLERIERKKIILIDYPLYTDDIILVRYKTSIGVYGSVFQETIDNSIEVTADANMAAQRAKDAAADAITAAQRAEDAADREILLSESEYELLVQNDAVDLTKKYLIYEDDN